MRPNRPRPSRGWRPPMARGTGQFPSRGGLRPPWPTAYHQNRHPAPSNGWQNYGNSRFEPYVIPAAEAINRVSYPRIAGVQVQKPHPSTNGAVAIKNTLSAKIDGVELGKRSKNEDPTTFEYQATIFLENLELTPQKKQQIHSVLNDVVSIWRQLMPDVRPVVYGSLSNGLATKYSDIDCFIDSDLIPDGAERIKLMLERWRWMFRRGAFKDVIPIKNARVPIIKAIHVATGIPIDLSCTSDSALCNTSLIHQLVTSDSRVRPLVLLVLSFYRERDLAGTFKFVSYAITLLVIFYLQNVEPPIFPPLSKLLSSPSAKDWPCQLSSSVGDHVDRTNDMSLRELFAGFFKFYTEIDFEKSVLSPYLGTKLDVELFKNPALLPDEFKLLKNLYVGGSAIPLLKYSFRLQDPILHDATPATSVTKKLLVLFTLENRRFFDEFINKRPPDRWLAEMCNLPPIAVPQVVNQKSVCFTIKWQQSEGWEKDFICYLSLTLEFLLFDVNLVEASDVTATLDVHSSFDVFNKRFRGRFLDVIKEPQSLPLVRKYFDDVKNNMKKPESSFCARITIMPASAIHQLKISVLNTNQNVKNTFDHIADRLNIYLEKLLMAVKSYQANQIEREVQKKL